MSSRPTPEALYRSRRAFLRRAVELGLLAALPGSAAKQALAAADLPVTAKRLVTSYNNYYEFSRNKEAVAILAQELSLTLCSGLLR